MVVRPLPGHLDLVRPGPARAHHQVQLRRCGAGVLPGAGKAPRQQPVHLHHRRIGDQHVSESFQYAGVAHLARSELRHQLAQYRPKHPGQFLVESVVERRGHQRLARHSFVGASKTGQRALTSGSESQQYRPQHRAGIDLSSSANCPAFVSQTLNLRLRQQRGQCLSNTNTLVSGHGHPPDRLKLRNSNLIRGRGPLQLLVSSSIPLLSEHECYDPGFSLSRYLYEHNAA